MNTRNTAGLQIVLTPTFDWLAEQAKACSVRLLIGSPYVSGGIINLTNIVGAEVSRTLVTRTDLRDFATGSSSLDTLCCLARGGTRIRNLSERFHAKMYIFDQSSALVTSANATFSGLYRNLECGIGTTDELVVSQLAQHLLSGFGEGPSTELNLRQLNALHAAVEAIKVTIPKPPHEPPTSGEKVVSRAVFTISDQQVLLSGFSGWRRLTLRGVLEMPDEFRLQDFYDVWEREAAAEYPNNHNVRAKLRQQLQLLCGLGLIDRVSPGQYRRTMN